MDALLVAKLYWRLLEFEKAQAVAEEALEQQAPSEDLGRWIPLALFTVRLYRDTFQNEKFDRLWGSLQSKQSVSEFRSALHCFEGMLAAESGDLERAERLFQIAEVSALNETDLTKASYGLALIPYFRQDWVRASRSLFQLLEKEALDGEVRLAVHLSLATVAMELGQIATAEAELVRAQRLVRSQYSLYNHVMLLLSEAFHELRLGNLENVRYRIRSIEQLIPQNDKNVLGRRFQFLKQSLAQTEVKPSLELRQSGEKVSLHWKGQSFEIQKLPQLLRLILLFQEKRGQILQKEEICRQIWNEDYHPLRHDNKIYVTIKRLRAVFRSLASEQEIILKKESGYLLNPEIHLTLAGFSSGASAHRQHLEVS